MLVGRCQKSQNLSQIGNCWKEVAENGKSKKSDEEQEKEFPKETISEENLREKLLELREDLLAEISNQLHPERLFEKLGVRKQAGPDAACVGNKQNKTRAVASKDSRGVPDKQFKARNSMLTDLFQIEQIATIYNVFIAVLISLIISIIIHDLNNTGSVNLGFKLLIWNFSYFSYTVLIWITMKAFTIVLYYGYEFWAKTRARLATTDYRSKLDTFAITVLIMLFMAHLAVPGVGVRKWNLPFAAALTVVAEKVRLFMKMYAFIRTNVPRTLEHEPSTTQPYFIPSLDKYVYYLFAPTFMYKDQYPRTSYIRWKFVAARFFEMFCVILYMAFLFERYTLPTIRNFGKPDVPFYYIIVMFIDNCIPGILGLVCIFYVVLHSWLNGMAEILTFADREFYTDWWNTSNYAEYYKTWNIVVYDWLYAFVYRDAGGIFFQNRWAKAIFVIFVSAAFHEFVMTVSLGYFIPGFIILYGFGGPLMIQFNYLNRTLGNIWIWFTLGLGSSIMLTLYLAEYFARVNCPRTQKSDLLDFWIPRMITCYYS